MIIFIILIYYFVQSHIDSNGIVSASYHIKEGGVPAYLYHKFDIIKEEIFPRDIKITLSLSTIRGTLLYTIDRHNNQFIVSLQIGVLPTFVIEFNTQQYYVPFKTLCGCDKCMYQRLEIEIQISDVIFMRCNGGGLERINYVRTTQLNKEYPIPYSSSDLDSKLPNEAHMWLVNFPQHKNIYPVDDQLSGCIFDVSYNNERIVFTNISDNIGQRCLKTCNNNVCNGGQCYETFNSVPICDCTQTFMNGRYCNRSLIPHNIRSIAQSFIFSKFKVSWRSSVREILILKNEFVQIILKQLNGVLIFEFRSGLTTAIKETLAENYIENKEYILIANLTETAINTKFLNNGVWQDSVILTNRNMHKEIFTSLTLRSGDGVIDLVQMRNPMDYMWNKVVILKYEKLENEPSIFSTSTQSSTQIYENPETMRTDSNQVFLIAGMVGLVAVCVILLGVVVYCNTKRLRTKNKYIEEPGNNKDKQRHHKKSHSNNDNKPLLRSHEQISNDPKKEKQTPLQILEDMSVRKRHNLLIQRQRETEDNTSWIAEPDDIHFIDCKKGEFMYAGSFGAVYSCVDDQTGRHLAMEEVLLSSNDSINVIISIENTIKTYMKLEPNPRIVRYYGTSKEGSVMHIYTEYMALGAVKGPLQPDITIRYTKQILEGLDFLHKHKIIHGDIRCCNVLRDIYSNIKLHNFGMNQYMITMSMGNIKDKHSRSKGEHGTSKTGCNDPYWTAPEIIRGDEYSVNADVWAVGATVTEMLTGKHPYPKLSQIKATLAIERTNKIEYELQTQISPEFQLFIDEMLNPDPFRRARVDVLLRSDIFRDVLD